MESDRDMLAAVVARLLPIGPGTPESVAPVVDHIQEVLCGPFFAPVRPRLETALERLDELARERHGEPFPALGPAVRDEALSALEREGAEGSEPAALLFRLLVPFVLEASLRSPIHGGEPARRARAHMGLGEDRAGEGDPCRRG